jgi:hypothetical protein
MSPKQFSKSSVTTSLMLRLAKLTLMLTKSMELTSLKIVPTSLKESRKC